MKHSLFLFSIIFPCLLNAQQKQQQGGSARNAMVAACHPQSTDTGLEILRSGGTAADAFIAATFVDFVVSPGLTSLSGPLGALVYDASSKNVLQLSAEYNYPLHPEGQYQLGDPTGKQTMIPGALAGLWDLHQKYGKLPWRQLIEPAKKLATEGFPLDDLYVFILQSRIKSLLKSDDASQLFFDKNKELVKVGHVLKQPLLAKTLFEIQKNGPQFFYSGAWGHQFLSYLQDKGSKLTTEDLKNYQAFWIQPLTINFHGKKLKVSNFPVTGGVKLGLSLQVAEKIPRFLTSHWNTQADLLAKLILMTRIVSNENWLLHPEFLSDPNNAERLLNGKKSEEIFELLQDKSHPAHKHQSYNLGHSYHVIVIDENENIVTGTNTINSIPFGEPVHFIAGVPLNSSALAYEKGLPGKRVNMPFTNHIVFDKDQPIIASGVFGASLYPADFQLLSHLIIHQMSPFDAVATPMFGSYFIDYINQWPPVVDKQLTIMDLRFPDALLTQIESMGVKTIKGSGDTGFPVVITRDPQKKLLQGMTPFYLKGKTSGY